MIFQCFLHHFSETVFSWFFRFFRIDFWTARTLKSLKFIGFNRLERIRHFSQTINCSKIFYSKIDLFLHHFSWFFMTFSASIFASIFSLIFNGKCFQNWCNKHGLLGHPQSDFFEYFSTLSSGTLRGARGPHLADPKAPPMWSMGAIFGPLGPRVMPWTPPKATQLRPNVIHGRYFRDTWFQSNALNPQKATQRRSWGCPWRFLVSKDVVL